MSFDYNTQRKRMSLPEYGRNVLKMIEHIKSIEDAEERNRAARTVIQIMGNLNPNLRDVTDFRHKLWDHLMIIADFDLSVDSPYAPPDRTKLSAKPNRVPYHNGETKYAHYGQIIPSLIEAAACQKAVVATDVQGCREVVRHEVNGLLVPPRDVESLAAAVTRLCESAELRERMGQAGRAHVLEQLDERIVLRETYAVYRALLERVDARQTGTPHCASRQD